MGRGWSRARRSEVGVSDPTNRGACPMCGPAGARTVGRMTPERRGRSTGVEGEAPTPTADPGACGDQTPSWSSGAERSRHADRTRKDSLPGTYRRADCDGPRTPGRSGCRREAGGDDVTRALGAEAVSFQPSGKVAAARAWQVRAMKLTTRTAAAASFDTGGKAMSWSRA